jgi:hypothetical protein
MGKRSLKTLLAAAILCVSASGCGAPPAAPESAESSTASTSSSATPSPAAASPEPTPTPTASPDPVFTTADGLLSFSHPVSWSVGPDDVSGAEHAYLVKDEAGETVARLGARVRQLAFMGVPGTIPVGTEEPVPGLLGAGGKPVRLVLAGSFGQAVGGQSVLIKLQAEGDPKPLGSAVVELEGAGFYVDFSAYLPLQTVAVPPSEDQIIAAVKEFGSTPRYSQIKSMMASLRLNQAALDTIVASGQGGCLGARYRYEKLVGVDCAQAKGILSTAETSGTPSGARNMETPHYTCFYASAGEKQGGQADVLCRSKANTSVPSFEAWLK